MDLKRKAGRPRLPDSKKKKPLYIRLTDVEKTSLDMLRGAYKGKLSYAQIVGKAITELECNLNNK